MPCRQETQERSATRTYMTSRYAEPNAESEATDVTSKAKIQGSKKFKSSWDAKQKGAKDSDGDFLSELGRAQDYNINVEHGIAQCLIEENA